jgi:roadblock/LC7 domain-containing protein
MQMYPCRINCCSLCRGVSGFNPQINWMITGSKHNVIVMIGIYFELDFEGFGDLI